MALLKRWPYMAWVAEYTWMHLVIMTRSPENLPDLLQYMRIYIYCCPPSTPNRFQPYRPIKYSWIWCASIAYKRNPGSCQSPSWHNVLASGQAHNDKTLSRLEYRIANTNVSWAAFNGGWNKYLEVEFQEETITTLPGSDGAQVLDYMFPREMSTYVAII